MYICFIIIKTIREMKTQSELKEMGKEYYSPSGTYEYYSEGYFYNNSGQQLRAIQEYNPYEEGYTPFGDE